MALVAAILAIGLNGLPGNGASSVQWAIQPQFDVASDFSQGLAKVGFGTEAMGSNPYERYVQVDRYGYINLQGAPAIPTQFKEAGDFSDGLAWVKPADSPELFGYIDTAGKLVIPPRFTTVGDFVEGLAPVTEKGQRGYIDRQGRMVLKLNYDYLEKFSAGLARVVVTMNGENGQHQKVGYIDRRGKLVIPLKYTLAQNFSQGLAMAATLGRQGYIDRQGRFAFVNSQLDPSVAGEFSEGFAVAELGAGACSAAAYCEYRYIGRNGQVRLQPSGKIWTRAGKFSGGLAPVATGGGGRDAGGWFPATNWGYINGKGKWAIAPQFNDASSFSEGLAKVKVGNKYGYIKAPQ
jgi:WG containing repeat